jgi:hypothetical protein
MVGKVTACVDKTFNFSLSWSPMQYWRMVRSATTVSMVVKVIATCEHKKIHVQSSHAFMHQHYLENG